MTRRDPKPVGHSRLAPSFPLFSIFPMTDVSRCTRMKHSLGLLACAATLSIACAQSSVIGDLSNPDAQKIQLVESERLKEYEKRNYTWPLNNYSPNTPGWKALMEERFAQIGEMENDRYEGYIQTIHSAFLGE